MQNTKNTDTIALILFLILFAIVIAAVTAAFSPGAFNTGFQAALKLSVPGAALMALAWLRTGRGKLAAIMMLTAFVLRLAAGLATAELLPKYGYTDEPQQKQGYLFDDAFRRDEEAWRIANEEQPSFFEPLGKTYNNDQYGGMTVLGIWIYRFLSPEARRFQLLILLGAFVFSAGTAYLLRALREWEYLKEPAFGKAAVIAAWIYVLYPDSIVYSASPMREPFLMGLLAVAFWALTRLKHKPLRYGLTLLGIILVILPFSYFIAGALVAVSLLWIWAERLIPRSKK